MNAISRLWNWWIKDALGCRDKTYSKVTTGDIVFACFMTFFVGLFLLFIGFMLLCGIIASKGVLLFILAILGGAAYGIFKAIEVTAKN